MQESTFKIYNASAGSGKTYALSKAYLKIVLSSPYSFKRILAITFTNKAVNEMKFRILDSLYSFSKIHSLKDSPPLFLELMDALQLSVEGLRDLCRLRLKEILHNYAFFDISTIDKFTHRVIRTFARDLKLPQNFEVVLDMDLLLSEAVARVLAKAGEDQELTKILMDFAMEKIDDDKSWDIGYDLLKIGKLLQDETNTFHIQGFGNKSLSDFLSLQKHLKSLIRLTEMDINDLAEETLAYIGSSGVEESDFPRQTLPNHFRKILDGTLSPFLLYNNNLEGNLVEGKILKVGVENPSEDFAQTILRNYLTIKEKIYQRGFLFNLYGNLVPLTLLNSIENEIKNIQREKEQLSISEFNRIISEEIKNQPAPFIYERLGEKYRHYFIDEFQDTSEMQWNNLVPLIANALEGKDDQGRSGSLFLVGDAKQAIYRWRGGHAEQFLDLATKKNNPFSITGETHQLPRNYRSQDEIVKFNNTFFQHVGTLLENDVYRDFFIAGNKQESNDNPGGYVKISFLQEEDDTAYADKVMEAIDQSLQAGFNYGDICVLVRKKKHGVILTDFLMSKSVPVISSDSLLVSSSPKVQFLVSLVKFMLMTDDLENNYSILEYLSDSKEDTHDFIHLHLNDLSFYLTTEHNFDVDILRGRSLMDSMEHAIKVFDLVPTSDAHLLAFMDFVFEMEQKHGTDAQAFLNNWEVKSNSLSISTPEDSMAVQVMTIHKSKGLEFPVVIFPYANTNIFEEIDPKLWIPVDRDVFMGFEELLISKKQEIKNYGKLGAKLFDEEHQRIQLDAFNLLYVVLTRAVNSLYVISCKDLRKDGSYKTEYFSGLFLKYLSDLGIWKEDLLEYEFGELWKTKKLKIGQGNKWTVPYLYTYKNREAFKIHTKAGMLWDTDREIALEQGNVYHHILENVITTEDLEPALKSALNKGVLSDSTFEKVRETLIKLIHHPVLGKFYSEGSTIYNEKELLISNGTILIPDRVVLKGNSVDIIDYKTGRKNNKYKEQLESYSKAYQEMGYTVQNKIIAYINEEIIVDYI
ncbi:MULTISPECIES: UvrD-helicase domain-containing protein [Maribacter]|uniref:DNA 3'-5' helicase n=1 Tax=Maribacter flavus TaxID=1658664 RepID=A0ABU7IEW1_9FLAO|nr:MULTISPECIES: UvrD-helicase domain-containing protein [Maribacter]MDC6404342.1 UvrD-helicase domain-containing protein [Maribacter sp. PR66]MEE1971484.1 UvrD-helicase domain-containing protein [Maribacter flavus]